MLINNLQSTINPLQSRINNLKSTICNHQRAMSNQQRAMSNQHICLCHGRAKAVLTSHGTSLHAQPTQNKQVRVCESTLTALPAATQLTPLDATRVSLLSTPLRRTATHCNTLQHSVALCNTEQHPATHCTHCSTLQHTATHAAHYSTLLHITTRCSTSTVEQGRVEEWGTRSCPRHLLSRHVTRCH